MIKYELAKKLKDAGFTQDVAHPIYISVKGGVGMKGDSESTYARIPTLSELIEACGEDLNSMNIVDQDGKRLWVAHCCEREDHAQSAPSLEEAVANLWLGLNVK